MSDDSGNMSIDFLVGCTIFILAFIWVASMIPGMLINLKSNTVDFDAVAYRTGVILVEDPGLPESPPWETFSGDQKPNVTRFGLALTKSRANILSGAKVNRFTCSTAVNPLIGFEYPEEYHSRVIFGDYPYHYNISIRDIQSNEVRTIGEILPSGYGYIRRLAKIKGVSNATIGFSKVDPFGFRYTGQGDSTTGHTFSILFNNSYLTKEVKDPAFQIDPQREEVMVNITEIRSSMNAADPHLIGIELKNVSVYTLEGTNMIYRRTLSDLIIDDTYYYDKNSTAYGAVPPVQNSITLKFSPAFSADLLKGADYPVYVNLTFNLTRESSFLNNTYSRPFDYNYNPSNVTQPPLHDAIVEVAVW